MTDVTLAEAYMMFRDTIAPIGATTVVSVNDPQDPTELRSWAFHPPLDEGEKPVALQLLMELTKAGKLVPNRLTGTVLDRIVVVFWLKEEMHPQTFTVCRHPQCSRVEELLRDAMGMQSGLGTMDSEEANALPGISPATSEVN